ncbi:MAG: AAA family ATPase, partial [Cyanobacteria bacterium J06632_19]
MSPPNAVAGWVHYHKSAPKLEWFQNVESMLNHHLAGLLGLGCLSWAGHQIHVSLPINKLLDAGVAPQEIPLPHELIFNRDLMAQLLSESDGQLSSWKNKILQALGENGQVIVDVIPELERIIGEQAPVTELSGTAAQNRFNLLFQKFIQVFTTKEHPLVIFLDDLQWADSTSLQLIQLLMNDSGYLLMLGAYRDNEVFPAHPLMLTLEELKKAEAIIQTITLSPLSEKTVNQLVADTLSCCTELAQPLTHLIFQKTQGNPFFTTQFLKALHEDSYITFDINQCYWQCNIAQVKTLALTNDVVEFMALQLQKLPHGTQQVLKLAACIGNQFDLSTLAIVCEQSTTETALALWKALQFGLILPTSQIYKFFQDTEATEADVNPSYQFLHDRVQQAGYSLIPSDQKQATHLKIGNLLCKDLSAVEQEEKLFDIVSHLNRGQTLITQQRERENLARLNLKAGTKAINTTAYAASREYLQTGIELLEDNCWKHQYELTLELYVAATEASYLNSDFPGMEQLATLVLQQAQRIFDKVKIYEIKIAAQASQNQILAAIAAGREALTQLGVEFPTEVEEAKISQALEEVKTLLDGRNIAELIDLPSMSDRTAQAAMQLLSMLFAPLLLGSPDLLPLLGTTMVRLSLEFGNAPISTVGYATHAMVLCSFFGEVEAGYEFGSLALSLLEKLNAQKMKCMTLNLFGGFIYHHRQAFSDGLPVLKECYKSGMETGVFFYAAYSIQGYCYTALFVGAELNTLVSELDVYSTSLAQIKQESALIYLNMIRQTVHHLRETVSQPDCLIGKFYDETEMFPKHQQAGDLTGLGFVHIYKLQLAYMFGNYPAALDYINQCKTYLVAVSGAHHVPIFHFYAALTYLALFVAQPEHNQLLTEAQTHQNILHQCADNAPMNHLHKWYLVKAEKHRVLGENAAAIDCYDQAITLAKENQYVNEAGLINELTAKFYLNWGKDKVAATYMQSAYYCYAKWGAKAKTDDLEK